MMLLEFSFCKDCRICFQAPLSSAAETASAQVLSLLRLPLPFHYTPPCLSRPNTFPLSSGIHLRAIRICI